MMTLRCFIHAIFHPSDPPPPSDREIAAEKSFCEAKEKLRLTHEAVRRKDDSSLQRLREEIDQLDRGVGDSRS